MSVSMVSRCNQNIFKSKKERIFNSRSHRKRVHSGATRHQNQVKHFAYSILLINRRVVIQFCSQDFEKTKRALDANAPSRFRQGQIWPKSTALTQPFLWHHCHDWIWQTYRNEANISPCRLNKCARRITGRIGWRFFLIFLGIGSVGLWFCKEATSIFLPGSETPVPIEN